METMKKEYMAPEMEVIDIKISSVIMAGSPTGTDPSGQNWEDEEG